MRYYIILLLFASIISCKEKKPDRIDTNPDPVKNNGLIKIDSLLASDSNVIITIGDDILMVSDGGEKLNQLTNPQKVFYYIYILEGEVNNGGFNQYFFNSSGEHTHQALDALKQIKASHLAGLLEKAIATWPNKEVPVNTMKRRSLLQELGDDINPVLDKLDDEFYQSTDSLSLLLLNYVKANKRHFQ
jgi:hypothetical protein